MLTISVLHVVVVLYRDQHLVRCMRASSDLVNLSAEPFRVGLNLMPSFRGSLFFPYVHWSASAIIIERLFRAIAKGYTLGRLLAVKWGDCRRGVVLPLLQ